MIWQDLEYPCRQNKAFEVSREKLIEYYELSSVEAVLALNASSCSQSFLFNSKFLPR
jgi:hypothetical protein